MYVCILWKFTYLKKVLFTKRINKVIYYIKQTIKKFYKYDVM